jgi:hypothetical protein
MPLKSPNLLMHLFAPSALIYVLANLLGSPDKYWLNYLGTPLIVQLDHASIISFSPVTDSLRLLGVFLLHVKAIGNDSDWHMRVFDIARQIIVPLSQLLFIRVIVGVENKDRCSKIVEERARRKLFFHCSCGVCNHYVYQFVSNKHFLFIDACLW